MPERAYREEVCFQCFSFPSCARLGEAEESPRESEKILLFSQVVLYHKFRKNLAIALLPLLLGEKTRKGWLPPECHRAGGALWPSSAGRLGSSSLVAVRSKYNSPRQRKAVVIEIGINPGCTLISVVLEEK